MEHESYEKLQIKNIFNVSGKIALITGGGTGIGKMMAKGLASNGAKASKKRIKVIICSKKSDVLKRAADEINSNYPNSVVPIASDLRMKEDIEKLVEKVKAHTSVLHVLVNNSGMTWADPIETFNESHGWDDLMSLNVKAPFYLSVLLSPLLQKGASETCGPSRIINISSIGSILHDARKAAFFRPNHGIWSYCSSKAALNHLTTLLANEFAKKHINVNLIMPGVFPSKMTNRGIEKWPEKMHDMVPTGRFGDEIDICGTLIFMCSRASAQITGSTIIVDGGSHIL